MDIADWRKTIDELDYRLVQMLSERAQCAREIGKLKKNSSMPIYEPDRERIVFDNIARCNPGPLSDIQLRQVYERLIDADQRDARWRSIDKSLRRTAIIKPRPKTGNTVILDRPRPKQSSSLMAQRAQAPRELGNGQHRRGTDAPAYHERARDTE